MYNFKIFSGISARIVVIFKNDEKFETHYLMTKDHALYDYKKKRYVTTALASAGEKVTFSVANDDYLTFDDRVKNETVARIKFLNNF